MRRRILAVSLITLLAPSIAAAVPPASSLPMTPTGPWHVDFADRMCLLDRPFGKDGAIKMILKPAMLGSGMEIIVTRSTAAVRDAQHGKAELAIAGKKIESPTYFSAYRTAKERLIRILVDDNVESSALRGTLSIDAKGEGAYLFSIAGIERAMPVLAKCIDQLRAIYKVRDADIGALATKPKGSMVGLFTTDDYPVEALRQGQSGTVGALTWVEADGRISTCEIVESNASPALEQATCNIFKKRARYIPTTDVAKKAVRAPTFVRIRWQLPSWGAF